MLKQCTIHMLASGLHKGQACGDKAIHTAAFCTSWLVRLLVGLLMLVVVSPDPKGGRLPRRIVWLKGLESRCRVRTRNGNGNSR